MPLCRTAEGCPIQAEAQDPAISRYISGYLRYKELERSGAPESLQIDSLRQCGALPLCPDFLLVMNPILTEAMKTEKEKQEKLEEWRRADEQRVNAAKAKAKALNKKRGRR